MVKVGSSLVSVETANTADAEARDLLTAMFEAAVAAADPARVLAAHLPEPPAGRCVVVGAGKAAGAMAAAVEAAWPEVELTGIVTVPYGHVVPCRHVVIREAGHPLPDENSVAAAREILATVTGLGADDLVLALISGGGSATMALPAAGLSLEDKRTINRLLLRSGLDIRTMNAVRRRISAIKGGKLAAAAAPARVVTLAISDIPGDDAASIASGPTAPDIGTGFDPAAVLARIGDKLPPLAVKLIAVPDAETRNANSAHIKLIARPAASLAAAAEIARGHGFEAVILGDDIEGESRDVATHMATLVSNVTRPTVFISGGETTVSIEGAGAGRGGRNTEFALALAEALQGNPLVWAIAADTDGEDGDNLGAAGALIAPDTISRGQAVGLDHRAHLLGHDSGSYFAALGDLIVTGPTRTNVNDFRAILVRPCETSSTDI